VSRLYNLRAILVNPRIIIGRNRGTKSYAAIITTARKAIYNAFTGRRSKRILNWEKREPSKSLLPYTRPAGEGGSKLPYSHSRLHLS